MKNAFFAIGEKVLRPILGIFVVSLLARSIQVEEFGIYNSIFLLATIVCSVSIFGVDQFIIASNVDDYQASIYTAIVLTGSFCIISILFWVTISIFYREWVYLFATGQLLYPLYTIYISKLTRFRHFSSIFFLSTTVLIISTVLKLTVLYLHLELSWIVLASALEPILALCFISYPKITVVLSSITLQSFYKIFKRNLKISAYMVLSLIFLKLDILLAWLYTADVEFAFYTAATRISDIFVVMLMAVLRVVYSKIKFSERRFSVYRLFIFLTFIVSFIVYGISGIIINIILSDTYVSAASALSVLAFTYPFLVFASFVSYETLTTSNEIVTLKRVMITLSVYFCIWCFVDYSQTSNSEIAAIHFVMVVFSAVLSGMVFKDQRHLAKQIIWK